MEINPYERIWIRITIAAVVVMLVAIALAGFGMGTQLPGEAGAVDPRTIAGQPPFNEPGVYEMAPGKYQVIMVANTWAFNPKEVRVPVGSEVTFKITSRDVTHGMMLEGTNINIMILPGQVSEVAFTFDRPGSFVYVCHEYCGVGHQAMSGTVIVEP